MHLTGVTSLLIEYRYWIIIPLSFLEGPIIALVTGTLSSLGYFNPFAAIWIFFAKDMIVDGFYYYLGRYAKESAFLKRILEKGGLIAASLESFKKQWHEHGFRMMFMSKLPHGFSPAFLATAGITQMGSKRFFTYAGIIALLQYGVLFVVGYYFGKSLSLHPDLLNNIQYILTGVLFVGLIYYGVTWYVRHKIALKQSDGSTGERHY